jgi:glycosyltransferase involved in cell wall biosynthesis
MKIVYIATYPPRKCGIATFTENLVRAIHSQLPTSELPEEPLIVALQDGQENHEYPPQVKYVISQNKRSDYIRAADFIHEEKADVCILQHEFGIFGARDGIYILSLVLRLQIPLIVTLHTVLKEPSYLQKIILQKIAEKAEKIVVMSRKAVSFLTNIYQVPVEKIAMIEHGVPDCFSRPGGLQKGDWPFQSRRVILTFGLLSRNKGIETVIRALPHVVSKHPEVLYLVLGNTHPGVIRSTGETYRNTLKDLVNRLGLQDHVRFIEEFVSEQQLINYLSSSDIYITPYLNKAQITSGTLSYAVGAGTAVISTPYWHAQELLNDGRGRLFPFGNSRALADIIIELLDDPRKLQELREKAFTYGKRLTWSKVGAQYGRLIRDVQKHAGEVRTEADFFQQKSMPVFRLDHVLRMTDHTGILQHAKYGIPNLKEGYCLDDNARALMMSLMAWHEEKNYTALKLVPVYLSFIHYMQCSDGYFRNFLGFNRQYLDKRGSEDAFGRTIWALGYLIRFAPKAAFRDLATELVHQAAPHFQKLISLRGIADTLIGICHYLQVHPADENMLYHVSELTEKLVAAYKKHMRPGEWYWPEEKMTYDNGILPLALWHSFEITGEESTAKIAGDCTHFLETKTLSTDYLIPVGNKGWYRRNGTVPLYDQQAIEAMSMVLLYQQAYLRTEKTEYLNKMIRCYQWFLGENTLGVPLYDEETCACFDGLESTGINYNQGAESTLAYLIAHLAVAQTLRSTQKHLRDQTVLEAVTS